MDGDMVRGPIRVRLVEHWAGVADAPMVTPQGPRDVSGLSTLVDRIGQAFRMSEEAPGLVVAPFTHVVVVGLMGSGKTTVGRALADRLGWPFRDSDPEIQAVTGRTVRELRDDLGVDAMHDLEADQLLDALAAPGPAVVAPA